jgi:Na+-driven multidrug efflux pump
MSETVLLGVGGAAVGVLISIFANVVVLPWVLQQGSNSSPQKARGLTEAEARKIKFVYRYLMPPCFIVAFTGSAITQFGGTQ